MKVQALTILFFFALIVLTSCASDSQPTYTEAQPTPTFAILPFFGTLEVPPTSTPFVHRRALDDCLLNIDLVPGKTDMDEVIRLWGEPSARNDSDDFWSFNSDAGAPSIYFKDKVAQRVRFYLKNCSLESIVSKLGPPEKVEVLVAIRHPTSTEGPSSSYWQAIHYPALGFSFGRHCDAIRNCYIFRASDTVSEKNFYPTNKTIKDCSPTFHSFRLIYEWRGFDVDVQKAKPKEKPYKEEKRIPFCSDSQLEYIIY